MKITNKTSKKILIEVSAKEAEYLLTFLKNMSNDVLEYSDANIDAASVNNQFIDKLILSLKE